MLWKEDAKAEGVTRLCVRATFAASSAPYFNSAAKIKVAELFYGNKNMAANHSDKHTSDFLRSGDKCDDFTTVKKRVG